jgi:uracil-DNA glycosylase
MSVETREHADRLAHYLEAMGVQRWVRRSIVVEPHRQAQEKTPLSPVAPAESAPSVASVALPSAANVQPNVVATEPVREVNYTLTALTVPSSWPELQQQLRTCQACPLCQSRQQVLVGEGDLQAAWLFVTDYPDADEDAQGQIFPAPPLHTLLDALLHSIGLMRTEIYLTMAVKCYPLKSRSPTIEEQQTCRAYLTREIELIQPQMIIALGGLATQQVLNTQEPLKTLRGQFHYYEKQSIPVMPTYHPQYLLHRPIEKRKVWQDLQQAYHYCQQVKE